MHACVCVHVCMCVYVREEEICVVTHIIVLLAHPGLFHMQKSVKDYCVRIAEDDGEIDSDFPCAQALLYLCVCACNIRSSLNARPHNGLKMDSFSVSIVFLCVLWISGRTDDGCMGSM